MRSGILTAGDENYVFEGFRTFGDLIISTSNRIFEYAVGSLFEKFCWNFSTCSKDSGPHEFIRNLLIVSKMKVDLTMLEYPKWL